MTRRRVTLACVTALVVWACSCGVKGPVPWWITAKLPAASAATQPVRHVTLIGPPQVFTKKYPGAGWYRCEVWYGAGGKFFEECAPAKKVPKA